MGMGFENHQLIMGIQLNNLTLTYERHPAIHHLTATIAQGEWLAIVGPNGAGKSTLLNAIAGLKKIHEGRIEGLASNNVTYLPQQTQLDKSFPITVLELVAMGLWGELGYSKPLSENQYHRSVEAIAAVGLRGFEGRMIDSLSGGQMQRSLFARVLLQDNPVILLDEPFNAIDSKTISDLTSIIQQWHKSQRTVIMVSHDLDYVKEFCPRTMLLARECIGHGPTQEVLCPENLERAQQLSEAFDEHAQACKNFVA